MESLSEQLRAAESALQDAMLAGDARALERLLDADAVYVGPDGVPVGRSEDIAAHREGLLRLRQVRELEADIVVRGHTGVTRVLVELVGSAGGHDFEVTYRYTRAWQYGDSGWQVLAAHASALTAPGS